ncbi:hypothetical protein BcepSauron_375 [Burkholderia phage BcepSauron]|uniref:Uncharacterized protein n=1 Tax=Burkholderia phage BcepSauron TaxID=2530033 RepID=A0A482MM56_9CAUD|nr:hypothetical protein H1O17_gp375 [Burkholderia phage BcepSauron]QBQ74755.1 hypothetical protein BcepSauron_375 [Burkholderia phage BcepSauron]
MKDKDVVLWIWAVVAAIIVCSALDHLGITL